MVLKEKIKVDLDKSLKSGEKLTLSTLRLLSAAIVNKEIEKRTKIVKRKKDLTERELIKKSQLEDSEIIQVILSEIKKRKEAILLYKKGKREDLAQKEEKETKILEKYLPEQISDEELKKLVKEAIAVLRASLSPRSTRGEAGAPSEREKVGIKDMGKVMKELMIKVKGRAEGSKVSQIVKELLSK